VGDTTVRIDGMDPLATNVITNTVRHRHSRTSKFSEADIKPALGQANDYRNVTARCV